jgi:hypothetical protein
MRWHGFRGPEAGRSQGPRTKLCTRRLARKLVEHRDGDVHELAHRTRAGHAAEQMFVHGQRDATAADKLEQLRKIGMIALARHAFGPPALCTGENRSWLSREEICPRAPHPLAAPRAGSDLSSPHSRMIRAA